MSDNIVDISKILRSTARQVASDYYKNKKAVPNANAVPGAEIENNNNVQVIKATDKIASTELNKIVKGYHIDSIA